MKAIWNNTVIAESDNTVVVEGSRYFPPESVKTEYLSKNGEVYECPRKGHSDYYDVTVNGETAKSGAWMYPEPNPVAAQIKGYYAFWNGVEVTE